MMSQSGMKYDVVTDLYLATGLESGWWVMGTSAMKNRGLGHTRILLQSH